MTTAEIQQVVSTLRRWGYDITPEDEQDLQEEFRTVLKDPAANSVGPFTRDSITSKQAALDNFPRSGSQRQRVLQLIIDAEDDGATRDEIAAALELPDSSADGRVWELKQGGWVIETDEKRKTRNGSLASVLVLSDQARDRIPV